MSDEWGPAQIDPVEPDLTLRTEAEVTKSSHRGGRIVAGVIGVFILVAGTTFAATQLGSSGPASPEDAVSSLLDAASNEDILGVLAALDPGERDALRQPVQDLVEQLQRLEVLAPSFSLDGVAGVDLEFSDVTYRTEPVRDDLVRVYLTGGTVTGGFTAGELPVGSFVTDTIERFGGDLGDASGSDSSPIGGDDTFVVAHKTDDGWHVSIGYTIAEAARLDAGLPLGAPGIEPVGADSPEAAVEGMARAAAALDLRGMIARLSPGEFGALQDYAGLFVDRGAQAMADADVAISIDDIALHADRSGDRATVFIDRFAVTVVHEGHTYNASTDGKCFTLTGDLDALGMDGSPFDEGPVCAEDLGGLGTGFFGLGATDPSGTDAPAMPSIDTPTMGITTTQVGGRWYVAPLSTVLDGMVATLSVLDRSDLDAMVDAVESMSTSFEESFSSGSGYSDGPGGYPDSSSSGSASSGDWAPYPTTVPPGTPGMATTSLVVPGDN